MMLFIFGMVIPLILFAEIVNRLKSLNKIITLWVLIDSEGRICYTGDNPKSSELYYDSKFRLVLLEGNY